MIIADLRHVWNNTKSKVSKACQMTAKKECSNEVRAACDLCLISSAAERLVMLYILSRSTLAM